MVSYVLQFGSRSLRAVPGPAVRARERHKNSRTPKRNASGPGARQSRIVPILLRVAVDTGNTGQ